MKKLMILLVFLFASVSLYSQDSDKVIKYVEYHDNGQVRQIGEFTNNKLSGKWILYNEFGYVRAIGYYDKGLKTGTWVFNKIDKVTEVTFKKNKITDVREIPSKNLALNF